MGQKVSPIGFRLSRRKRWNSLWYSNKQEFGNLLHEDRLIRKFLMAQPSCSSVSKILVRRMSDKIEVTISTARPGQVIGKRGAGIETLKAALKAFTGKNVWVEVDEIKRPDLDAQIVADLVSRQLSRRMSFRRVMKKAIQASMDAGALGIAIEVSGRLGGAEIARTESYQEGRTPRHTIKIDLDYATSTAKTPYGLLGVKVWVNRGEDNIK